jgi:hypothetical protein
VKLKVFVTGVAGALAVFPLVQCAQADSRVESVDFISMDAPATLEERADIYSSAKMEVTYRNGKKETHELQYHQLMVTTEEKGDEVVGGLWNYEDNPISDDYGQMASDAPDGNSLLKIPGTRAVNPAKSRPLIIVTQFEYREVPPGYPDYLTAPYESYWSKLPATMGVSKIEQNKRTGALDVVDYEHINFADVKGAGSTAPLLSRPGTPTWAPRSTSQMPRCGTASRRKRTTATTAPISPASANIISAILPQPILTITA